MRRVLALLLLCTASLGCERDGDPVPVATGPNIILVSLDTLRAKSLGVYGYPRDTSPFFDSLVAQGFLFTNAFTTSATTGPAHMSIFTGLYPRKHGNLTGFEPKRAGVDSITTGVRDAGYRTAAFTENGFLIRKLGFDEGFDEYHEIEGPGEEAAPGFAARTFERARQWIAENQGRPYFLFVHTYQVHHPYKLPPGPYSDLFAHDGLPGSDWPDIIVQRDLYDREIRYLDDQLRDFVAAIRRQSVARPTVTVILSDHGEEFDEHGQFQHGANLFDEVLRVPLLFWSTGPVPGEAPLVPAGQTSDARVSLIDVAPTLLDFAGVEVPDDLDGISLRPIMAGAAAPQRTLFAEATADRKWVRLWKALPVEPLRVAILDGDEKIIAHRPEDGAGDPTVAFDLASDPGEQRPRELEGEELAAAERQIDEYLASGGAAAGSETPRAVDPSLLERLRSLGYVE